MPAVPNEAQPSEVHPAQQPISPEAKPEHADLKTDATAYIAYSGEFFEGFSPSPSELMDSRN